MKTITAILFVILTACQPAYAEGIPYYGKSGGQQVQSFTGAPHSVASCLENFRKYSKVPVMVGVRQVTITDPLGNSIDVEVAAIVAFEGKVYMAAIYRLDTMQLVQYIQQVPGDKITYTGADAEAQWAKDCDTAREMAMRDAM